MRGVIVIISLVGYLNVVLTRRNDKLNNFIRLLSDNRINDHIIRRLNFNELPDSNGFLPGHALIRPAKSMLKSAVKYPHGDDKLVYGNLDNLGITFGNTSQRVLYTGFRKENDLLDKILKLINETNGNRRKKKISPFNKYASKFVEYAPIRKSLKSPPSIIVFKIFSKEQETLEKRTRAIQDLLNARVPVSKGDSTRNNTLEKKVKKMKTIVSTKIPELQRKLFLYQRTKFIEDFLNNKVPESGRLDSFESNTKHGISEEENNANEELDQYSSEEDSDDGFWHPSYRRMKGTKKMRKERDKKYISLSNSKSFESASSDYEKNPGNPYTIYRDKYKKNWMWNHAMDGDHMNINPLAPQFANIGPSGAELFFGRKWWYYNQDDYRPME